MSFPAVMTVLFHPDDPIGKEVVEQFVVHFDRLGMHRAGVNMRVPVRIRSAPLRADGSLLEILPEEESLHVILVLQSQELSDNKEPWLKLCHDAQQAFAGRSEQQLAFVIVDMARGNDEFAVEAELQAIQWWRWQGLDTRQRSHRLLINTINVMRRQLGGLVDDQREAIFISHAKLDGREAAERVLAHINDPNSDLRLATFYDARDLEVAANYRSGLRNAVVRGTILSLITDAYDERPWCNQEILWAKEARRAILMVDIGRQRVDRSFPYAGNVPVLRDSLDTIPGIERILLELLSEALRCDLFLKSVSGTDVVRLPRPPELADLAFLAGSTNSGDIVYPGPALPDAEVDLLRKLSGGRAIRSTGDL